MLPLRVYVLAVDGSFETAAELVSLLEREEWCSATLHHVPLDGFPPIELSRGSLAVIVGRDHQVLSAVLAKIRPHSPEVSFLFVNLFRQPTHCLDLLVAGFENFLSYPFQPGDVAARMQLITSKKPASARPATARATDNLMLEVGLLDLIGASPLFNCVLSEIRVLASVDATVLITGETGTGKDMSARAIHYTSLRSSRPFLPLNCGAIPDELFVNELFGHEQGAYTDARARHTGLIQQAEGGTLFLDDVESLSLNNQTKLLRFLQGNEYTPLGGGRPVKADVRIIAATNADLLDHVRQKTFRQDVYFRLEVLALKLPPLRERVEDIPLLANHLIARYCSSYGKSLVTLSPGALQRLSAYDWPGNVRQLENVIHKAVVHATSQVLGAGDIDFGLSHGTLPPSGNPTPLRFDQAKEEVVTRFEIEYVTNLLRLCGGNITRAAECAGKHRRAFWEIMRRHNLTRSALQADAKPR